MGDGTFTTAPDVATGDGPYSLTATDVNGDGQQDLLVATASNKVLVRLGNGDGTFTAAADVGTGDGPTFVTAADVNGDGSQDLLVANVYSDTVSVRLGRGDSTFTRAADVTTGAFPTSVTVADVNGDGRQDLLVANRYSNTISVRLGVGDGTFTAVADIATADNFVSVAAADLNGDGGQDLLVTTANSNTVSVLLNTSSRIPASLDLASVASASGARTGLAVDTVAPTVTGLTTIALDGAYKAGSIIDIQVGFSEVVTVSGTPRLTLETGAVDRSADYVTSSGTASLVFRYTVQPGDTAADLDALTLGLNGGTIRDAAGNDAALALPTPGSSGSLAAAKALIIDTTAPSVPTLTLTQDTGASHSDRITRDPGLVITADQGAVLSYAIDGGAFSAAAPGFYSDGSQDGAHTVRVRATDAAGNVSGEASLAFILDTRTPAAPGLILQADTGASAGDRLTRDARLAVAAEPGASLRYSLDGAPETAAYDPAALADGVHTVAVTQTDAAGNVSAAASLGFTLDRTAPAVIALAPDMAGPTNAGSLTQTVTFSEAVTGLDAADFGLVLNGTAAARIAGVSGSGTTYTVTLADVTGDGTLRLDLAGGGTGIRDLAGNAVAGGFAGGVTTLDHTAPTISLVLSSGTGLGERQLATDPATGAAILNADAFAQAFRIGGRVTDARLNAGSGTLVTLTAADGHAVPAKAVLLQSDATGPYYAFRVNTPGTPGNPNAALAAALIDGRYTLTAATQDTAGNIAQTATRTLIVDTTADAGGDTALVVDATSDGVVGAAEAHAVAFTLTGLDADATAVAQFSDGTASRSLTLTGNGSGTVDLSGLNGTVASTLTLTDHFGNTVTRTGAPLALDTVAPAPPGLALMHDTGVDAGDRVTADPRVTVTPAEAGGTLSYTVDGAAVADYDPASLVPGMHTVGVAHTDAAGNTSIAASLSFALNGYFEMNAPDGTDDVSLTGTPFADLIRGNGGNNTIRGEGGYDYLHGLSGNDSLDGGLGNDTVLGDLGDDRIDGGAGDDQVRGWLGNDVLFGSAGNDGVFGEEGNDFLGGGSGDDGLSGGSGIDSLYGEEGDDLLFGNAGDDELVGGAGRDLFGFGRGDGHDLIRDFVTGGAEADVIAFNNGAFVDFAGVRAASRQEGADVVIGYGDGDTITMQGVRLEALTSASFTFA